MFEARRRARLVRSAAHVHCCCGGCGRAATMAESTPPFCRLLSTTAAANPPDTHHITLYRRLGLCVRVSPWVPLIAAIMIATGLPVW